MRIDIHIYHHVPGDDDIKQSLNLIIQKLEKIMALNQAQFDEMVDRLNKVTDDIAADYKKLLDEIEAGKITDESVAAAKARLAQLEALGASVENPVPVVE